MVHFHRPKIKSQDLLHKYRSIERRKLKLTMAITGTVMVVEVIGGFLTGSLALLSDAGHMFTHFFALGITYAAILCATKEVCHHRTYGFYRVEILAALFNSLFLFGVTGYIFYEGVKRLLNPQPILGLQMFFVALLGLVVNTISVFILHGTQREDLNVKGAFLHMLADTASSVVIVIGAVIIYFTSWLVIDPLLSLGIAVVIFCWAWGLFRDSINVLLETAPKGINADIVSKELKENISEIKEISDIHIWEITSKMYSMTAHIKMPNMNIEKSKEILDKINRYVNEKYDIEHTTIQFEPHK